MQIVSCYLTHYFSSSILCHATMACGPILCLWPGDALGDDEAINANASKVCPTGSIPWAVRNQLPPGGESSSLESLPPHLVDEIWAAFNGMLGPVYAANSLGAVVFQFQTNVKPCVESYRHVEWCRQHLDSKYQMAVEFRSRQWYDAEHVAATTAWMRGLDIALIASDDLKHEMGPSRGGREDWQLTTASDVLPVAWAVTTPKFAYVRIHRREGCHRVLSGAELRAWADRLRDTAFLKQLEGPIYFMWGTDWEDQPLINASKLGILLGELMGDWEGHLRKLPSRALLRSFFTPAGSATERKVVPAGGTPEHVEAPPGGAANQTASPAGNEMQLEALSENSGEQQTLPEMVAGERQQGTSVDRLIRKIDTVKDERRGEGEVTSDSQPQVGAEDLPEERGLQGRGEEVVEPDSLRFSCAEELLEEGRGGRREPRRQVERDTDGEGANRQEEKRMGDGDPNNEDIGQKSAHSGAVEWVPTLHYQGLIPEDEGRKAGGGGGVGKVVGQVESAATRFAIGVEGSLDGDGKGHKDWTNTGGKQLPEKLQTDGEMFFALPSDARHDSGLRDNEGSRVQKREEEARLEGLQGGHKCSAIGICAEVMEESSSVRGEVEEVERRVGEKRKLEEEDGGAHVLDNARVNAGVKRPSREEGFQAHGGKRVSEDGDMEAGEEDGVEHVFAERSGESIRLLERKGPGTRQPESQVGRKTEVLSPPSGGGEAREEVIPTANKLSERHLGTALSRTPRTTAGESTLNAYDKDVFAHSVAPHLEAPSLPCNPPSKLAGQESLPEKVEETLSTHNRSDLKPYPTASTFNLASSKPTHGPHQHSLTSPLSRPFPSPSPNRPRPVSAQKGKGAKGRRAPQSVPDHRPIHSFFSPAPASTNGPKGC
eukprot:TRINITY_DN3659_c0_g1_i3.p1 TRINITY_DN3659_c0_g1~~TRINITY_DN3659_c0_g1_i3.p1  ORF type:complete len:884 (+),score=144.68 TRINITY_DN3659_c0_g1_i3:411-3062(+)